MPIFQNANPYGPIRAKMVGRCKPEEGVIDFDIEFFEGGLEQFAHGLAGMQFARGLTESLAETEQGKRIEQQGWEGKEDENKSEAA